MKWAPSTYPSARSRARISLRAPRLPTKAATKAPASRQKASVKKMPAAKKTVEKLAVKSDEKPWTAKELGEVSMMATDILAALPQAFRTLP